MDPPTGRRPALALACVVLLVLAGCSALAPAPGDGGRQVTPAPVPVDDPDGTVPEGRYPPGVGPSGVTDALTLAGAHERRVANRSYTLTTVTARARESHSLNVVRTEDVLRVRRPGLYRQTVRTTSNWFGNGVSVEERVGVYADGTTRYVRTVENGSARYDQDSIARWRDRSGSHAEQAGRWVARYLDAPETAVRTVTRDGRRGVRIRGRGDRVPWGRDYRVVAHVESGVVVHLDAKWVERREGGDVYRRVEWTYDRMGATTVSPPEWYGAALEAANGS